MNTTEFKTIIAAMNAIWNPKLESPGELDLWYSKLKDWDFNLTQSAVNRLIDTETFRPGPAKLKEIMLQLTGTARISTVEAWAEHVRPILSRYTTLEQIEALPPDIRQAVNKAGRLSYLATLPEETARRAFMGAYNAQAEIQERSELIRLAGGQKQIGGIHGESQGLCHLPG